MKTASSIKSDCNTYLFQIEIALLLFIIYLFFNFWQKLLVIVSLIKNTFSLLPGKTLIVSEARLFIFYHLTFIISSDLFFSNAIYKSCWQDIYNSTLSHFGTVSSIELLLLELGIRHCESWRLKTLKTPFDISWWRQSWSWIF